MRIRLLGLLVALLLLPSCITSEADRQSLQRGYSLYNARQPDEAKAVADKFIAANPNSDNLDEALYLRGISQMTRGGPDNRRAAADDLHQAIAKSQRPDLKAKAFRALGDIDFDAHRWPLAQTEYQQAFTGASTHVLTHLNYRLGATLQAQGQWDKAQPYFQRVAASNDDQELKERAVARLNSASFGLQFGAFQEKPRAQELDRQLSSLGIPAAITTETREGRVLYVVRSGSYHTWELANTARDRLLAKFPLVTIVP
jgi:outer membrane protein assembly factor BamD (BamD/ComL family)